MNQKIGYEKKGICISVCCALLLCMGCQTMPRGKELISRRIASPGTLTSAQLTAFFMDNNPAADRILVGRLAALYVSEGKAEEINSDAAFCQMCLETGFLRFGSLVTPDMHNYCGLGSMDADHPGERFETEQLGVRAHIQHLHAYGTKEDVSLHNALVDRRYRYVNPRGKAPDIYSLAGTWAADKAYGQKLDALLAKLESY